MDGVILLTGATGLLGRYLVRDLSAAGAQLAVVVRPTDRKSAESRVAGLLAAWEQQGLPGIDMPHVLSGDITQPGLGLSTEDRQWVADHCDMVLHSAASLAFEDGKPETEEPWLSNLTGTRYLLDLCRETGIVDFHHISTSYVAGLREGLVREDELDMGQEFANDYERSKLRAEQLVRSTDFLAPPTIYRPAIIVGDSQTGFTTTFHGFYAVVKLAVTLARMLEGNGETDWTLPLHELTGDEVKNLVPVDWVSAAITELVSRRERWGATYHLTPSVPTRTALIRDVIEAVIGHQGTSAFTGPGSKNGNQSFADEIESTFYEQLQVYATYWRNDPTFDQSNVRAALPHLPCPVLDHDRLVKLAETAVAMNFRYRDPRPARVTAE